MQRNQRARNEGENHDSEKSFLKTALLLVIGYFCLPCAVSLFSFPTLLITRLLRFVLFASLVGSCTNDRVALRVFEPNAVRAKFEERKIAAVRTHTILTPVAFLGVFCAQIHAGEQIEIDRRQTNEKLGANKHNFINKSTLSLLASKGHQRYKRERRPRNVKSKDILDQ